MVSPANHRRFGRIGMPPQTVAKLDHHQQEGTLLSDAGPPHEVQMQHRIKCVLVGDGAIGKTSLVVSYTTNGYPTEYVPTAFDNYAVEVTVDNCPIRLQLCDTAGQDDFDSLRPLCYPGTDVFLVCFSVVSPTSFHNVREKWLPELQNHYSHKPPPIVVIGTQCDLRNDVKVLIELAHYNERPVTESEAKVLASRINAEYIECSALTQKNMKEVFDSAILAAVKHKGMLDENCNSSPDTPLKRGGKKGKKVKEKKVANKEKEQQLHQQQRTPPSGKRLIPAESKELIKPSKGWKKFCCMV